MSTYEPEKDELESEVQGALPDYMRPRRKKTSTLKGTSYEEGAKSRSPSNQKGPIDREIERKEHRLTKAARKVRSMGVRVKQQRDPASGRVHWKTRDGKTYDHRNFEAFVRKVLSGNKKKVTLQDLGEMANRYTKWVSEHYIIPKPEMLAKDPFPKPWYKGDPDPKWDPLIKVGNDSSFWGDIATAMGFVFLVASVGQLGFAISGGFIGDIAIAGLDLATKLGTSGLKINELFSSKTEPGKTHPDQKRYIMRLVKRKDILHRYFNANESGVAFDVRLNCLQLIEGMDK